MSTIHNREFGIVYEGDAPPIHCMWCAFTCHGDRNMAIHERTHRRTTRP